VLLLGISVPGIGVCCEYAFCICGLFTLLLGLLEM
jgi:hypothetical protein